MRCEKPMKSRFADIDNAIKVYIANEISMEKNKELEELVFFSSYTIKFDVFKKATQKLKKIWLKILCYVIKTLCLYCIINKAYEIR